MTRIKPDGIIYTNLIEAYTNYDTPANTITISGSVANGATANFTCSVLFSKTKTLAEVFATNRNTGEKMTLLAGSLHHPYQPVSTESDSHTILYTASSGILLVTLTIDNFTGAGIVLTSQIWDITPVLYDVPYLQ